MNKVKNMINVLIIDDEMPARQKLQNFVESDQRFKVIGQAKNGKEALNKITELQPDLLLLDIQMPGMTGFDVLRLMDKSSPAIIFTTAYDEYAVQAFEVSAVDYLLKPISEQRLQQALNKVTKHTSVNWDDKVNNVLNQLQHKRYIKTLAVRHLQRVSLLKLEDICFIISEHRLINVYNNENQRYWTNENLTQLESRLDPELFMRIHRNAIINLAANFEIQTWDSGRLKLHFKDKQTLIVSREYAKKLKRHFDF